ncbi:MAG: sulfur carrier protein ThiS [Pseudomonadota bacterium]|nr:sulfur carrier protein ThiS [Pseudomonadota bacterium]
MPETSEGLSDTPRCHINGQARVLPDHRNLQQLIFDDLSYPQTGQFVVALNSTIIPAAELANHALRDGDRIDILGAITGG